MKFTHSTSQFVSHAHTNTPLTKKIQYLLSGPEVTRSTVCMTYEDQSKDIHWALGHPENTGSTHGSGNTKHY